MRMTQDQEANFWARVVADPGSGCWLWGGAISEGYGSVSVYEKTKRAHRVLYEHENGPIPAGLELDHLCRNRACVRPDHLEPVTRAENQRRGFGATGVNGRKTHCVNGHEFTPDNTRLSKDGIGMRRYCRKCVAIRTIVKWHRVNASSGRVKNAGAAHVMALAADAAGRKS